MRPFLAVKLPSASQVCVSFAGREADLADRSDVRSLHFLISLGTISALRLTGPNLVYWAIQAGLLTPLTFARHRLSPLVAFISGVYFLHNGRR